ncbi:MAG: D-tyrosyl-tRNA(Tyr) deacylase [Bacteroidetes bacterium]|nr:D-tyrosyl-tRNA(Tyr) deacylase [Bacteroidota bacterium]MCW5894489.1 D-tyrosyl-tRNA(Tyr) deacylase [Bacteroidota bacterium]
MRAVIQRVSEASVTIDGTVHASIKKGFVILLGIRTGDTRDAAVFLADRCSSLRVFEDGNGKMNLDLNDVGGSVIVVSQFTLYGNVQKGNRPSFIEAARPEEAEPLYDCFVERMKTLLCNDRVATGIFRAMMEVKIVNDGPVTILMESK